MLSSKFRPWHVPIFLVKYVRLSVTRMPVLVHFEVTLRCNARCDFCNYWKTDPKSKSKELSSFVDAAKFFNPMMITYTGGEPTLRRDLEDIVAAVDRAVTTQYSTLITHGGMMTPERAKSLWDAGIHQFNFSLDYLDERHDKARGIPGLSAKIFSVIPQMKSLGVDSIRFNTVIRDSNLDQLMPIVRHARELGVGVNFSSYTDSKNGNPDGLIRDEKIKELEDTMAELKAFKRANRGVITNSDYYLEHIPLYVRGLLTKPCRSGIRTVHVDPSGHVKRCPDFPTDFHWTNFRKYEPIDCNKCFYACRGEAQAPITINRIRDVMATQ
ncbi:MAG: radical SAM protein [Gemmatimonadaceae bacterium]